MRFPRPPSAPIALLRLLLMPLAGLALFAACDDNPSQLLPDDEQPTGANCTSGTACASECVDLATDPNNCGSCGRTCVISQASAACVEGDCALSACKPGWLDCDAQLANGCEVEDSCDEQSGCTTSCNTTGQTSCADPCAPACMVPAESCNAVDDDCNGACDDGNIAGCRVGIHRSFGPLSHFYTANADEATALGQNIEALDYFYLYNNAAGDLRPFFRCKKGNNKRWMTTSTDCEVTAAPELTMGFIAPQQECGSVPLFRLQNVPANAHFYTVSAAERDNAINNLGFADEGIAGYVWLAP